MGAGNSVLCFRNEERWRWLVQVGCSRFELDDGVNTEAALREVDEVLRN